MGLYNNFKTGILLALLTALLLWVGSLFGQGGFIFAIVLVILMNFFSYFYSDKIVLKMYKAQQVNKNNAPKLYQICKELASEIKIPMPKIYIIPDKNANAFATGRNEKHSAIAVTQGILDLLDKRELKGVIAHEFAHIKNKDILISTIAGMIAGIISYIGIMAQWSAIFGGDNDEGGNIIQLLVLMVVTPLIATIIQLAISRSREYLADSSGAKFIKDGNALADALEKLENDSKKHPMKLGSNATAHLFILNPFSARGFSKLLSTHPPMNDRVKKLREMDF